MGYDESVAEPRAPYPFRTHQRQALEAIDKAEADGRTRAWVVLPPGAGKTLVGLETARRRGKTTVVLGPNTAIQSQWQRGWDAFGGPPAGTSRDLAAFLTALTYQSLAVFSADGEDADADEDANEDTDQNGRGGRTSLLEGLHPNGTALVERLKRHEDLTLVLDECHHLLEVWGRLVKEVLDELPQAFVLALTATPPSTLTKDQKELVDDLFGAPVCDVRIPAVVREGDLAPFAELAWLTTPTPQEAAWLKAEGERFAELTTALTDPALGSTGFLPWLDERFATASWRTTAASEPALCDAALRMAHRGLLAPPVGARLTERHRHDPTADDWVLLVEDWLRHLRATGEDDPLVERIRQALPSVGYQLTRHGIRRGRSTVDRVLARSEAKTQALTEIVGAEHRTLGARLRMLVLCDHERAAAMVPVDLRDVVDEQAGSATMALAHLDEAVPHLHPLLVTGTTVTGSEETMARLRAFVGDDDLMRRWTSRGWLPWVTRFFEAGHSQVLVGTRGLLGEGWDARTVTGLVDLTTATTSTSVVQTRGRALRNDPGWPEKVALTWSVVCVSEDHPRGGNDWDRLVRKHEAFYGVDADGDVVSGVAHVDPAFSPYAPPPVAAFDEFNARALVRSERRNDIRAEWRIGTPYDDRLVHTVRVTGARHTRSSPPAVVLHGSDLQVRDRRPSPWRPHPLIAVGIVLAGMAFILNLTPVAVIAIGVATIAGIQTTVAVDRGRVLCEELAQPPALHQVAFAVADALHDTGISPRGAEAVAVRLDEHGVQRCALDGVPSDVSATFATALDEAVSPMGSPRYVVPRHVMLPPVDNEDGARLALGRLRPEAEVWHSVPTVLGTTAHRAQAFSRAWDRWVGGGPALYTGSPEGEGVLVTHRGSDPFAVTTVLRTQWS